MSILIFVLTISVLVLVHELGHFGIARCFNVSIASFSIGFGKPLFKWVNAKSKTEFRVSPILLGGYVRFSEESVPESKAVLFEYLALWKKILILLAGPLANLLCAFIALIIFFKIESYTLIPYIGQVNAHSLAQKLGLKKDQRIISVNHHRVNSWEEILEFVRQPQKQLLIGIDDSNQMSKEIFIKSSEKDLKVKDFFSVLGFQPMLPEIPAIIGKIQPGSVAEKIGLKLGDEILSIDGQAIKTMYQLSDYVSKHPNQKVSIRVKRNNNTFNLALTIEQITSGTRHFGKLGVYTLDFKYYPQWFHYHKESWFGALNKSSTAIQHFFKIQFLVWLNLKNEISQLSGPIGIAKAADQAWSMGSKTYLFFVIWLNIGLAVVNLLPIPILDGGQCLMLVLNKIFPSFLNQYRQKVIVLWSIIFLGGLFLVGLVNDCSF
jgi:regulator of sigma E protease